MSEDRIYLALLDIKDTLTDHGTRLKALEDERSSRGKWNAVFAAVGATLGGFLTAVVF